MNKEVFLLKKQIENRESTISFLNEIIEAQSKSIDELRSEIADMKSMKDAEELGGLFQLDYRSMHEKLCKKYKKLEDENESLREKLAVLFNAFDSVRNPNAEEPKEDTKSDEKIRHEKELRSKQWLKKREEVFDRYGKQCVECGSTNNIQVHHLVYRKGRHLWEYDVDELIPLCKRCHQKVHEDKNHKFHEKYIS